MEHSHDEIKDLVPAFVLGAVSAEETVEIRAHILSCEECMVQADSLQEATGALALTVDSEALPVGFADRVVALLEETTSAAIPGPRPRRRNLAAVLAAGVAGLVIAVLATSLVLTRDEISDNERIINALVRGEGIELRGPSGAVARMVQTGEGSIFVAAGLTEAPDESTYQVWLLRDGEPTSAGTFDISEGIGVLETDHSLEDFDGAAVTVEPDGGSPEPRGQRVLDSDGEEFAAV